MSIAVLAQAVPSASAGMNWLYQFTNNLTNLTTQNGGALTQLGVTELSAIAFFKLVSMVVNWNTSAMTLRFHTHPVRAGEMTNFLMKLIICSLLINYWVNPFPGASFGINHFFSYIAQAMVAAFDQAHPVLLAELDAALARGDAEDVAHLAHKLKGSVGTLGGRRVVAARGSADIAGGSISRRRVCVRRGRQRESRARTGRLRAVRDRRTSLPADFPGPAAGIPWRSCTRFDRRSAGCWPP